MPLLGPLPGFPSRCDGAASRLRVAALLLVAAAAFGTAHAGTFVRAPALQAGGALEGTVSLPAPVTRTAERYVGTDGSPRDVPIIPVVVYVQGDVAVAAARPSAPPRVAQRGETFHPGLLVVPLGTTVAFPNEDPVFHNVFSYSRPKRFDLGRYRRGESKDVRFDRPGYVKVMCEVHKWMRAGILVVDNPFYAIADDAGRFRIGGLPPGRHRLVAESFDRRADTIDVDVAPGGTVKVQVRF